MSTPDNDPNTRTPDAASQAGTSRGPEEQEDRTADKQSDVMGEPDRAPADDDVMSDPNEPPPGSDVMAPHGGDDQPES